MAYTRKWKLDVYLGWIIKEHPTASVTGRWVAEKAGVTLSASTRERVVGMIYRRETKKDES